MEIVAEIGASHGGSLQNAIELSRAAKDAGADSIKLQCWSKDSMARDPETIISSGPWEGKTLGELYTEARTPWEWFPELIHQGFRWFSSVFDLKALDFLEHLDCPRYKVSSFEIVDLNLIKAVAKTGKPMILSTGMASKEEIRLATQAARVAGCRDLTLLRCVSAYPAPLEHMNVATITDMRTRFNCKVGLSDHSLGWTAAEVAASLGADMLEKHIKLDANSLDSEFALCAWEFEQMVKSCRWSEQARGQVTYGTVPSEIYLNLRRGEAGRG